MVLVSFVLASSVVLGVVVSTVVVIEVRTTMRGFLVESVSLISMKGDVVLTDTSCASHGGHDDGGDV